MPRWLGLSAKSNRFRLCSRPERWMAGGCTNWHGRARKSPDDRPACAFTKLILEDFRPPDLHLTVSCSKGTYIRTLADDIGRKLGCGAYLAGLRRTAAGPVRVDECVMLEQLESVESKEELKPFLMDPNRLLRDLPRLNLDADQAGCFAHGNAVANLEDSTALESGRLVRALYPEGVLLGIGRWRASDRMLKPVRVLRQPES